MLYLIVLYFNHTGWLSQALFAHLVFNSFLSINNQTVIIKTKQIHSIHLFKDQKSARPKKK